MNRFWKIFLIIFCLKLILVILLFNGLPDLGFRGFDLPRGGDTLEYYEMSKSISKFELFNPRHFMPFGFSLIASPLFWFKANLSLELFNLITALINGLILLPLALTLIFLISQRVFKRSFYSWLTVLLFILTPYFFLIFGKLFLGSLNNLDSFIASRTLQLMWLQAGSDYLAAFLIYLAVFSFSRLRANYFYLIGLITALAFITRPQNSIIIIFILFFLAYGKELKKLGRFVLGFLPLFLMQIFISFKLTGSLTSFGYSPEFNENVANISGQTSYFSPLNSLKIFSYISEVNLMIYLPLIIFLAIFILGALHLKKEDFQIFVVSVILSPLYAVLITFFEPAYRNPRYFIPVLPFFIIIFISFIEYLIKKSYVKGT